MNNREINLYKEYWWEPTSTLISLMDNWSVKLWWFNDYKIYYWGLERGGYFWMEKLKWKVIRFTFARGINQILVHILL